MVDDESYPSELFWKRGWCATYDRRGSCPPHQGSSSTVSIRTSKQYHTREIRDNCHLRPPTFSIRMKSLTFASFIYFYFLFHLPWVNLWPPYHRHTSHLPQFFCLFALHSRRALVCSRPLLINLMQDPRSTMLHDIRDTYYILYYILNSIYK